MSQTHQQGSGSYSSGSHDYGTQHSDYDYGGQSDKGSYEHSGDKGHDQGQRSRRQIRQQRLP